jgi:hypothetical protein
MRRQLLKAVGLAVLLAACAGGCANPIATVSGEVSYDGQPIETGTIVFMPADGKGAAASGAIQDGRYTIENIAPGPRVVQIIATKRVRFARTSEEMAQEFAASKGKGKKPESAAAIPANAGGNNQKVDVAEGRQTLNFALTKPKK